MVRSCCSWCAKHTVLTMISTEVMILATIRCSPPTACYPPHPTCHQVLEICSTLHPSPPDDRVANLALPFCRLREGKWRENNVALGLSHCAYSHVQPTEHCLPHTIVITPPSAWCLKLIICLDRAYRHIFRRSRDISVNLWPMENSELVDVLANRWL
jgi:hypothetical protein